MHVVLIILLLLAVICFGIGAFAVPTRTRINFVALGLFFWSLGILVNTAF